VLGVGNATQGLHLALIALNVGVGDEVIVTPYSWISSASCVLMQNAVPVFCDIEEDTLGICPESLESNITERTKAIILVHLFGYPAKLDEICKISKKYNIPVIEDASHAHGALYKDIHIGTFGKLSVFSLHQRKCLSVGDGGIVCTKDLDLRDKIYRLRSFGDDELSYNYRMTEFAGALGNVALEKLDTENQVRINNAEHLANLLNDIDDIYVRIGESYNRTVYYSLPIEISSRISNKYDAIINKALEYGLPLRRTWTPLNYHPHFNPVNAPARGLPWKWDLYKGNYCKNITYSDLDLPVTNKLCNNRIFEISIHPPTNFDNIEKAAKIIKMILDNL